ncbi:hypothetical protein BH11PSE9_BH11PSE9_00980 [soil metagenome]
MNKWPVEELGSRFETLLDACIDGAPHVVMQGGVEVAALVAIDHWRRLNKAPEQSLKQLLLSDAVRTDSLVPSRPSRSRRFEPRFDRSG